MALSHHDQEALSIRVERKLVGLGVSRATIRAAVDQVCSAIHSSGTSAPNPDVVVVMSAFSTPDLASRVASALRTRGMAPTEMGSGSAGRFTVCAFRVAAKDAAFAREVGVTLGCQVVTDVSESELAA